ncbi:hypothetical protein [Bacteroides caecigallinarum]|uniref:hypothetical protein n=1 Tax=Bacteroides caecigallinarum TaxID=1411144 RepID=UPI001F48041B|nr:hypothetical protein [Bacteroides caecigallinarum]MCF2551332.1 hypothetical protein [Bacteroides caecigallinarum]
MTINDVKITDECLSELLDLQLSENSMIEVYLEIIKEVEELALLEDVTFNDFSAERKLHIIRLMRDLAKTLNNLKA